MLSYFQSVMLLNFLNLMLESYWSMCWDSRTSLTENLGRKLEIMRLGSSSLSTLEHGILNDDRNCAWYSVLKSTAFNSILPICGLVYPNSTLTAHNSTIISNSGMAFSVSSVLSFLSALKQKLKLYHI